jgi:hypothetical protein
MIEQGLFKVEGTPASFFLIEYWIENYRANPKMFKMMNFKKESPLLI